GRRTAEAHLHPQEVGTEDRDQRLDAVVTARTSATHLDTDAAERQVGIIVDGDHVSRVEAVEAREAPDRLPRSVVVRLWLHEEHALAVAPRLSEERPMRLTLHSDAPARRQPVDDAEAGVVPAACVPAPGVAEADHHPHALPFATLLARGRLAGGRRLGGGCRGRRARLRRRALD